MLFVTCEFVSSGGGCIKIAILCGLLLAVYMMIHDCLINFHKYECELSKECTFRLINDLEEIHIFIIFLICIWILIFKLL